VTVLSRRLLRLPEAELATRSFLFSLPHFAFISCAHQTTFGKKKKTYGNVLCGMRLRRGASKSKNLIFESKTNKLMAFESDEVTTGTCEKTNIHSQNLIFKQILRCC